MRRPGWLRALFGWISDPTGELRRIDAEIAADEAELQAYRRSMDELLGERPANVIPISSIRHRRRQGDAKGG